MNWYKISQRGNRIRILSYSPGSYIKIISDTGQIYVYFGPSLQLIKKLEMLIRQGRFGEGWQLLKTLKMKRY